MNAALEQKQAKVQNLTSERDEARTERDEARQTLSELKEVIEGNQTSAEEKLAAMLAIMRSAPKDSTAGLTASRSDVFGGPIEKQARLGAEWSVRASAIFQSEGHTPPGSPRRNQSSLPSLGSSHHTSSGGPSTTALIASAPGGISVTNGDWRPLVAGTLIKKTAGANTSPLRYEDPSHLPQELQKVVRSAIDAGRLAYESKGTSVDYFVSLGKGTACVSNKAEVQGAKRSREADVDSACSRCVARKRPCILGVQNQNQLVLLPLPASMREGLQETDYGYYVAS